MASEPIGRTDLGRWSDARPEDYFATSDNLRAVLEHHAGRASLGAMAPRLAAFGRTVAGVIEPAVATLERHREFPALVAYDGVGRRVERVEFHPAHDRATAAVWASGVVAAPDGAAGAFEQAALFYLLSHVGEGGVACPAVCTIGLGRALAHRGSRELRERYLARVRSSDAGVALRGSQFLTEVQGGSDVGANELVAVPDGDAWRLSGEKWFCSVADADLFAVTARPVGAVSGTRGLGCFLVPRTLDGVTPNGFSIRQLKDKLGTRCLASGEFDFDGALGWPIGEVADGFAVAVEELLNTSRWLNAVGSTGLMRRAYLEAASFAAHRRAFGGPIGSIPIVREQLAAMKVEEYAALSSTMALTALVAARDDATASAEDLAVHRLLVNANKFVTSVAATEVVHQAIEVLGGHGTIESFSPLPRLYRDAVVYESWEGTHNVLCAQIRRDLSRRELLEPLAGWVRARLAPIDAPAGAVVADALEDLLGGLAAARAGSGVIDGSFRTLVGRLTRVVQAAGLLAESPGDPVKAAVAQCFIDRHLAPGDAATPAALVDAVLGGDLA
jgi:alkylation response protein AidB-like acyl-CoA dehydrogenase